MNAGRVFVRFAHAAIAAVIVVTEVLIFHFGTLQVA